MSKPLIMIVMASLAFTGCGMPLPEQSPGFVHRLNSAPPGAPRGTCWNRTIRPAVVETVTEQLLVQPAKVGETGDVLEPAIYKTATHQDIVKDRQEIWFETFCARDLSPDLIASVQRALKARGIYQGPITSLMDKPTRDAVHAYQMSHGLDSDILSLVIARKLGLAVMRTSDEEQG